VNDGGDTLSPPAPLCYDRIYSGGVVVHSILLRTALIGALAAATLLAGCGRKGPLELPPSAQAAPPANDPVTGKPRPVMDRQGYPLAPVGEKKSIPLDWLID
jgi:predicted small lipoprotein YifL